MSERARRRRKKWIMAGWVAGMTVLSWGILEVGNSVSERIRSPRKMDSPLANMQVTLPGGKTMSVAEAEKKYRTMSPAERQRALSGLSASERTAAEKAFNSAR